MARFKHQPASCKLQQDRVEARRMDGIPIDERPPLPPPGPHAPLVAHRASAEAQGREGTEGAVFVEEVGVRFVFWPMV
jgi:hypothetical protein